MMRPLRVQVAFCEEVVMVEHLERAISLGLVELMVAMTDDKGKEMQGPRDAMPTHVCDAHDASCC